MDGVPFSKGGSRFSAAHIRLTSGKYVILIHRTRVVSFEWKSRSNEQELTGWILHKEN